MPRPLRLCYRSTPWCPLRTEISMWTAPDSPRRPKMSVECPKNFIHSFEACATRSSRETVSRRWNRVRPITRPPAIPLSRGMPSSPLKKDPPTEDLRTIAHDATFPVQYPGGLPPGTTLEEIGYSPSIMLFDYNLPGAWRRSYSRWVGCDNGVLLRRVGDSHDVKALRQPHVKAAFKVDGRR
jgi:hypothetical protein